MVTCSSCGAPCGDEARFCSRCGARLPGGIAEPRRTLATVVFCDLVGSTALGERLDPESLREVLARYFAACAAALQRHGGQIQKYVGDAVVWVHGLPRAHEDDAARGCRAAWDLRAAVADLSEALALEFGVRLQVRLGVHTGEVMAADPSRWQALVTGDVLNTAVRLEQAAPHGQILVSELTQQLAGNAIEVVPVKAIEAEGKAEPVPAFRLTGIRTAGAPPGVPARPPLVGRHQELDTLETTLTEATAARRCLLRIVVGEPGVGKSRLAAEFIGRLPPNARAVSGRCAPYGEGVTWWPLREVAEELLRRGDELAHEDVLPLLRLTGLEPGEAEPRRALADLVAGLARAGPAVLVLEDLHWAEPALLELLEGLSGQLDGVPALALGTARPEALDGRPMLARAALRLGPLDPGHAHALLEARGVRSRERREDLARAADGNPLFIEQLDAAGDRTLPPSLRALISARIDALDDAQRAAVGVAAVVGRDFWQDALKTLLDAEAAAGLPVVLAQLERLELIGSGRADQLWRPPAGLTGLFGGEQCWSFRHELVQETAYQALPKERRADLHELFASLLERRGGVPGALVGWHLERAAELRPDAGAALATRAARCLERAAGERLAAADPKGRTKLLSRAAALAQHTRAGIPPAEAMPEELLRPGDIVGGYRIVAVAGRGGMGVVYRAHDPDLGRSVALKLIAPALARDPRFRERFEREWRMAASLEHPNVAPVYRAGEDEGRLFLAMRFVDGVDLATVLADRGRLAPLEAAELVEQVARALDAAHARGLVHRDVKPANVLLAGTGSGNRVYLTDFGLTVERDAQHALTRTGDFVGSVAYVAPEQIRGSGVDARTDVYALGGVLHHCLTGSVPYPTEHELDALSAHLNDAPPRPATVAEDVPGAFDRVVARAMAKDPGGRHLSAGDLGRAALAAAHGERLPRAGRSVATGLAAPRAMRARLPPRGRGRILAGLAVVVAALGVPFAIRLAGGDGPSAPANPAGEAVATPIGVRVPPDELAMAGGFVWTFTRGAGTLTRVDPNPRDVRSFSPPVGIAGDFTDLAAGAGGLWTTESGERGGVAKIDPRSGETLGRTSLPLAESIVATDRGVWAITARARGRRATVARLDSKSVRVVASRETAVRQPAGIAEVAGSLWISDRRRDEVLQLDSRTLQLRKRIRVGDGPGSVAGDGRTTWVANRDDLTLTRIDTPTGEASGAPISIGKEIEDIALTPAGLWVGAADSSVSRLDAGSGEVIGTPIAVDDAPLHLAPAADGVWVASTPARTVQQLRPPG